MNVKYEVFLPYVLPYAPNCLELHAIMAVRNACIEFASDTRLLQADLEPTAIYAGRGVYDLDVESHLRAAHPITLFLQDRRLEPKSPGELDRLYGRDWQKMQGFVRAYTQFNPDQVVLALTPDFSAAGALTGRLAVMPSRSSSYVDALLFEDHAETIADGALARLLATPDQAYSDPQGGLLRAARFRAAKDKARADVNTGLLRAPLRVTLRRHF